MSNSIHQQLFSCSFKAFTKYILRVRQLTNLCTRPHRKACVVKSIHQQFFSGLLKALGEYIYFKGFVNLNTSVHILIEKSVVSARTDMIKPGGGARSFLGRGVRFISLLCWLLCSETTYQAF